MNGRWLKITMLLVVAICPPGIAQIAEDEFASHWPMQVSTPQGQVTLFQPQMEDLQGEMLSARAALAITQPGRDEPIFGVIWLRGRIGGDRFARSVQFENLQVTRARIPDGPAGLEASLSQAVPDALVAQPLGLSRDQLQTMVDTSRQEALAAADIQTTPPKIIFRDHPIIKIQYDGPPQLGDVKDSYLKRVVNTPFFVVHEPNQRNYYLKAGGLWFSAADAMGTFTRIPAAPEPVSSLADSEEYKDPQQPLPAAQAERIEVITATEPTEVIWTDGSPKMGTIVGTNLLHVTNTDADVFTVIETQQMFVLISGRWYAAPSRNGPWAFVAPEKLPADFRKIPPNSGHGNVLAHVAGTKPAEDALADTYVPQGAAIDRSKFDQPVVTYDGDPKFEPVSGTAVSYATNTSGSVVFVGNRYYACYQGVWYVSSYARGPWDLCTSVPPAVYSIPPSCPIYPVRYVHVYGCTPDYVYYGYTPGYLGCYSYNRVVVYGTGYYYRPWYGAYYYPGPCTYGFSARYSSYGGWGFSIGFGYATSGATVWYGKHAHHGSGHKGWGHGGFHAAPAGARGGRGGGQVAARNNNGGGGVVSAPRTFSTQQLADGPRSRQAAQIYERRQDVRPVTSSQVASARTARTPAVATANSLTRNWSQSSMAALADSATVGPRPAAAKAENATANPPTARQQTERASDGTAAGTASTARRGERRAESTPTASRGGERRAGSNDRTSSAAPQRTSERASAAPAPQQRSAPAARSAPSAPRPSGGGSGGGGASRSRAR